MRVSVVTFTVLSGCLLQACGGSSRLRCGEGTTERDGECVTRSETGGQGGSDPQGGAGGGAGAANGGSGNRGGSFMDGGAYGGSVGASGASSSRGGSAGTESVGEGGSDSGNGAAATPSEVEAAQALCELPEAGAVLVPDIAALETLLVGNWLRCDGAPLFGREDVQGIRFQADHVWQWLHPDEEGGLAFGEGFDNFGTWSVVDTSAFNGPNSFQVDLVLSGGGANYVIPVFATEPAKMRLNTMLGPIDWAYIGER